MHALRFIIINMKWTYNQREREGEKESNIFDGIFNALIMQFSRISKNSPREYARKKHDGEGRRGEGKEREDFP